MRSAKGRSKNGPRGAAFISSRWAEAGCAEHGGCRFRKSAEAQPGRGVPMSERASAGFRRHRRCRPVASGSFRRGGESRHAAFSRAAEGTAPGRGVHQLAMGGSRMRGAWRLPLLEKRGGAAGARRSDVGVSFGRIATSGGLRQGADVGAGKGSAVLRPSEREPAEQREEERGESWRRMSREYCCGPSICGDFACWSPGRWGSWCLRCLPTRARARCPGSMI